MSEKEKTKEEAKENATEDIGEGDKYETTPIIERARENAERVEKATAELKAENDRREKIMARQALGGETSGRPPEEKKEETPEEYAKRVMKGEL